MFRKIDERKVILSRIHYKKGTKMYEFYNEFPEFLDTDDTLQKKGSMFRKNALQYHQIFSKSVESNFNLLDDLRKLNKTKELPRKEEIDPKIITNKIKKLAKHYGADLVGIAKMEDEHYYSIHGRREETYSKKVGFPYKYGIIIAVQMDYDYMLEAPRINEAIETSNIYVKVAMISMQLSYFIKSLGYPARNNIDGDYLVNAPAVAVSAGLGELGRIGLLVNKKYGPRVRLAVVTTDIPLIADKPKEFDLKEFCIMCRQCAKACPTNAISLKKYTIDNKIKGWQINQEDCFSEWLNQGTDCGICLRACPFFHNKKYDMTEVLNLSKREQVKFIKNHEKYLKNFD